MIADHIKDVYYDRTQVELIFNLILMITIVDIGQGYRSWDIVIKKMCKKPLMGLF